MPDSLSRRSLLSAGAVGGLGLAAGLTLPGTAAAAAERRPGGRAATVIHNGRIWQGDRYGTIASALAVGCDGRILAVGDDSDVRRLVGRGTEVVDAAGGTVIAGIHDGHAHPMFAGLRSMNPSLDDAEMTVPQLQDILTGFLSDSSDKEPDGWLVVEAWNPVGLLPTGTVADKKYLDALLTSRPIALQGSDGHNTWVNSRALDIAGVDAGTPDPVGGIIVRDASGQPTGLLKDSAQGLVTQFIPEPTWDEMVTSFAWAFAQMAAGGITSLLDAWVEPWQLDGYAQLVGAGQIHQRVTPALIVSAEAAATPQETLAWARDLAATYDAVPRLRFGTIKVFLDGVVEYPAQTAALLRPYLDADGRPTDNYGELYVDAATLGSLASAFDAAGWQVHTHAIGDAAVRTALDGFQMARRVNGPRGNRHTVAHLQLVHPADYPRFAALDVVPDMQLQWATRNVWTMEALLPFIGPKRHARMYPARSLADAGARLAGGSDWPVDPLYPWNQVQTAIDRFGLYGEEEPLYPEQGLTRRQSLRMHTMGTAYQLHQERLTGSLERGKLADLVVLDRDITRGPVSDIKDAVPQLTLVGGRTAFDISTSTGRKLARSATLPKAAAPVGRVGHDVLGATRHVGCPCTTRQP